MRKRYKAGRGLSLNVLAGGQNVHVSFESRSDGSSFFETCDEDLQHGIEHNVHYGRLFFLDSVEDEQVAEAVQEAEEASKACHAEETSKTVDVTDIDDAKDYLAEKYGISRTMLRSKSAILRAAEERGISFNGI